MEKLARDPLAAAVAPTLPAIREGTRANPHELSRIRSRSPVINRKRARRRRGQYTREGAGANRGRCAISTRASDPLRIIGWA
jgi:hypothetical protein